MTLIWRKPVAMEQYDEIRVISALIELCLRCEVPIITHPYDLFIVGLATLLSSQTSEYPPPPPTARKPSSLIKSYCPAAGNETIKFSILVKVTDLARCCETYCGRNCFSGVSTAGNVKNAR
jgi:hypothetical protein